MKDKKILKIYDKLIAFDFETEHYKDLDFISEIIQDLKEVVEEIMEVNEDMDAEKMKKTLLEDEEAQLKIVFSANIIWIVEKLVEKGILNESDAEDYDKKMKEYREKINCSIINSLLNGEGKNE